MTSDEIRERQNEKRMLDYQYAARVYYNKAEILNYLVWGLCFITWIMNLFTDVSLAIVVIICIIEFIIGILEVFFTGSIKTASKLREYFDSYVLGIGNVAANRDREEKAYRATKRKTYTIQTTHTGHDYPPGVKDWYDFSKRRDGNAAIFECQKQNSLWDKKMMKISIFIYSSLFLALLISTLLVWNSVSLHIVMKVVLITAPIYKLTTYIYNLIVYWKVSLKIDGVIENLEADNSIKNLQSLQNLINERRALPMIAINAVHKRKTNDVADTYSAISKND